MSTLKQHGELHRLVYRSRATNETLSRIGEVFPSIMATACSNNASLGVTGALLACSGWFLQALEGPRANVFGVYRNVCEDRRHYAVHIINDSPVPSRSFASWSMCGRRISATDEAILETLEGKGFDPERFDGPMAMRLLNAVRHIQGGPRSIGPLTAQKKSQHWL